MTEATLTCDFEGAVPAIRLTSSRSRNAVTTQMVEEMIGALRQVALRGSTVALLHADPPTFCAGSDYRAISTDLRSNPVLQMVDVLLDSDVFLIAAVEGSALGGGVAILAACPVVIASESVYFSLPERSLGLFPGGVLPYVEALVGPRVAFHAALEGKPIDAQSAARLGLASEVVPADLVQRRAMEIGEALASSPRFTVVARQAWQDRLRAPGVIERRNRLLDLLSAVDNPDDIG